MGDSPTGQRNTERRLNGYYGGNAAIGAKVDIPTLITPDI